MKFFSSLAAAASLLATVSAHGGVGVYTIGTTKYQGWSPYNSASGQKSIQRQYGSFNPLLIADLGTANIRCNNDGTALGTGVSASLAAGDTIKTTWTQWTHRPAAVLIYMAKCPSAGCDSFNGAGAVWFKIDHAGLISGTEGKGIWAGDQIVDTLNWTVTIPKTLAPGPYLIRHELLALHQANNPQFYPECAQLTVTGSGTASPPSSLLVSFPGAYSATDPGINFNIDSTAAMSATSYPIPGPAVWDGTSTGGGSGTGSGSGSGGDAPSQPSQPAVSAAPATTLVTSAAPAQTSALSCEPVARYGQCGGSNYAGCTACASGSTCTKNGDYYSQCM
ncbi:carbohydrate-binding module family 1 protein [Lophiostoma macrostomum CBS 122681]|uniref:AA9 family lytic polysaccharide monooxygenase n=1 Tax=Lophiostoma macrostomum CBS 122681 TaxID=1314788 RepID=A0A6A6SSC2_9PLEO|nr:carbohydrate-binding module family 1 protein [Lophiostoma macrostomum CBS 122681]